MPATLSKLDLIGESHLRFLVASYKNGLHNQYHSDCVSKPSRPLLKHSNLNLQQNHTDKYLQSVIPGSCVRAALGGLKVMPISHNDCHYHDHPHYTELLILIPTLTSPEALFLGGSNCLTLLLIPIKVPLTGKIEFRAPKFNEECLKSWKSFSNAEKASYSWNRNFKHIFMDFKDRKIIYGNVSKFVDRILNLFKKHPCLKKLYICTILERGCYQLQRPGSMHMTFDADVLQLTLAMFNDKLIRCIAGKRDLPYAVQPVDLRPAFYSYTGKLWCENEWRQQVHRNAKAMEHMLETCIAPSLSFN